jgi:hypothetical protein
MNDDQIKGSKFNVGDIVVTKMGEQGEIMAVEYDPEIGNYKVFVKIPDGGGGEETAELIEDDVEFATQR